MLSGIIWEGERNVIIVIKTFEIFFRLLCGWTFNSSYKINNFFGWT